LKRLTAILLTIFLLINTVTYTAFADDEIFLDFEDSSDINSFSLWDDENESGIEVSTGGVDGGNCLKFVSERQSSKSWLPSTVTYNFKKLDLMKGAYIENDFSGIELYDDNVKKNIDVSFDKENNILSVRFKEIFGYEKNYKLILSGVRDNLKSVMPAQTIEFKTEEPPVKYTVKFLDENDNEISTLPKSKPVKVRVSIKNNTSGIFKGAVICSVYSDGELLDITQKITETNAAQIGSASFDVTAPEDGYIRIYFWDDCKEMNRNADSVFLRQ